MLGRMADKVLNLYYLRGDNMNKPENEFAHIENAMLGESLTFSDREEYLNAVEEMILADEGWLDDDLTDEEK